ncbi:flagellar hook-length control protein FliK [Pseudoalteromonas distincta]|uniref:flagellar hook-length control protein FliK n=1 Tax=Pseudoalteromonas distincta TaxID=77608 RepID=UPI0039E8EA94
MNVQVGNAAPKAEFESVNSKRVIANTPTSEEAEVQGKEFNEHALASQKEMDEGNTTTVADEEATGDESVSAESTDIDEKSESHYLLNPIHKQKIAEPVVNLQGLANMEQSLVNVDQDFTNMDQGLTNVDKNLADEPLVEDPLLSNLSTESAKLPLAANQEAQAAINTSTGDMVLNSLENSNISSGFHLSINRLNSNNTNRFTPEASSSIAQSISADLNMLVSKANASSEIAQPMLNKAIQVPVTQGEFRSLSSQPNADSVTFSDISDEQLVVRKNELVKHSINALSNGAFNIENRDLLNNKMQFLGAASNNVAVVDTFEWRQEKLKGAPNEWGQRLLNVLGDKVNLQIGQQVQRAQIRLDPPNLGRIEISISVDGDKTSVNLVTSNPQVRDAIAQTLDQLRQTLSQNGSVSVDLSFSDKQQEQNNNSDDEKIADNFLFTDNSEIDATKQSKTSLDWLNRLV